MESIILFIIIAIASSAIQNASQKNKQQKRSMPNSQTMQPNMQKVVKTVNKQNTLKNIEPPKKSVPPIQKPDTKKTYSMNMEPDTPVEGVQTEGIEHGALSDKKKELTKAEYPEQILDVTFEELQKSIIMAEVLGKPKALRMRRI